MAYSIEEQIEEYLIKLPREAQEVIRGFDWEGAIEEIGEAHDLNEEEVLDLKIMAGLILVNISPLEGLSKKIENSLGLTEEESLDISDDILNQIVIPIATEASENVASKIQDKNLDWGQNLNFILSGGSYIATLEDTKPVDKVEPKKINIDTYIEDKLLKK